jgi:hypothetical protein
MQSGGEQGGIRGPRDLATFATMPSLPFRQIRWLLPLLCFPLTGCLYTVQRFNDGTILPPGASDVTLGIGGTSTWSVDCPDGYYESGSDCVRYRYTGYYSNPNPPRYDTTKPQLTESPLTQVHLGWRLGVRKEWGPFTGAEIGWNLDVPTEPATMEFYGRLGLPGFSDTSVAHSITAGWGIGAWVDNSWWLEYSISRRLGPLRPWIGGRALLQGTRFSELSTDDGDALVSNRHLIWQGFGGASLSLGEIPVIPDWIAVEGTWTTPGVRSGLTSDKALRYRIADKNDFGVHVGFGWRFN